MRLAIAAFSALCFSLSVHAADEPKPAAEKPEATAPAETPAASAAPTRAETRRQAEAARAATEKRKRAELEAQCVIKPVMSNAEIEKCRAASR